MFPSSCSWWCVDKWSTLSFYGLEERIAVDVLELKWIRTTVHRLRLVLSELDVIVSIEIMYVEIWKQVQIHSIPSISLALQTLIGLIAKGELIWEQRRKIYLPVYLCLGNVKRWDFLATPEQCYVHSLASRQQNSKICRQWWCFWYQLYPGRRWGLESTTPLDACQLTLNVQHYEIRNTYVLTILHASF